MDEITKNKLETIAKALTEEEIDLFLETIPVYTLLSKVNEKYAIAEHKLNEIAKVANEAK